MDFIIEFICDILFDSLSERKIPLWVRRLFAIVLIIIALVFLVVAIIMIKDGFESSKIFLSIIGFAIIGIVMLEIVAIIKEYKDNKK